MFAAKFALEAGGVRFFVSISVEEDRWSSGKLHSPVPCCMNVAGPGKGNSVLTGCGRNLVEWL